MLMVLVIVTLLVPSSSFPLSSDINGDFVSRLEEIFNKVINRALQAVQIDCTNKTENKIIDGKQVTVNSTKCVGTGDGTEISYDTQAIVLNDNTTSSNQNETTSSSSEETTQTTASTSEAEENTQVTTSTSVPEKTTQTKASTSEPEKTTQATSSTAEPEKTTKSIGES
ncbi:hypothetical protein SNE40_016509 [Patella caerulea]|uniref:Uncharacterized protein n=1 Tax=Patella caerulea TaxID=87958 RepID=A0AAN8JC18_PATCE